MFLDWSREALLEAWIDNPIEACEKAGVTPTQGQLTPPPHCVPLYPPQSL